MQVAILLLTHVLLLNIAAHCQTTHYVLPSDSSSCPLSSQPCYTLQQYAQQAHAFFVSGTTFVFLTGDHYLQSAIFIGNIDNIGFRGAQSNIVCSNEGSMQYTHIKNLTITGLKFIFQSRYALKIFNCELVQISDSKFKAKTNRSLATAISSINSTIAIESCVFEDNLGEYGGALAVSGGSHITLNGNIFWNNQAKSGGAIIASKSRINIAGELGNIFAHNSASTAGGAITLFYSHLVFTDNTTTEIGPLTPWLKQNAVSLASETVQHLVVLYQNSALYGGAIYSRRGQIISDMYNLHFIRNRAQIDGGAISMSSNSSLCLFGRAYFHLNEGYWGGALCLFKANARIAGDIKMTHNSADRGGAIFSSNSHLMLANALKLSSNVATEMGGALFLSASNITITGTTVVENNTAKLGGGIFTGLSDVKLVGNTTIAKNKASQGGALYIISSQIHFRGTTLARQNLAETYGGVLYASESSLHFSDAINIISNTAKYGGALYLVSGGCEATLILELHTVISAADNYASEYGGVIYHKDVPTPAQCRYIFSKQDKLLNQYLPPCFIELRNITSSGDTQFFIHSHNNTAAKDGNFLSGGLLERCHMKTDTTTDIVPYDLLMNKTFNILPTNNTRNEVTSKPYQLCVCTNSTEYDCSGIVNKVLHTGQTFNISLLALAQGGTITSTLVTSIVSASSRLKINQSTQTLSAQCSELSYNLYSTNVQEKLALYPDGPCRDTELAIVTINVTFLPCPDGFMQDSEECICEDRLQEYDVSCVIDKSSYILTESTSRVWMNYLYENDSYQGLILYNRCPDLYCTQDVVHITPENTDIQCGSNRSGVLCGACASNYSLMLGSSQCRVCSNTYLTLLLPFAAAGIVLVIFLTLLKLTVSTGMINGIILYANIVQVNKHLFLPADTKNVLTVFIAWMNLDLGFNVCFYDGMDAYTQIWLQFAFPLYIWILTGLIIIVSRYSITASKLIGSNPVAVLATLLLMSYTKILRINIEVYSSVDLDYPSNKTVTVWLKDANVPYLQSKHLALTVVTSVVLACLFLPYTFFLLLGYKLYKFTAKKPLRWLNKIKPLLDSYYAPYKKHTRHWTGLLLVVRCALYIVFSYSSLGNANKSHLAIIIAFTIVVILAWLSIQVYENFYTNVMEAYIYLNLIALSAATLAGANSPTLMYILVGTVFATTVGVIIYHFYICYIAKLPVTMRIGAKIVRVMEIMKTTKEAPVNPSAHTSHDMATRTAIPLREPLLETSYVK